MYSWSAFYKEAEEGTTSPKTKGDNLRINKSQSFCREVRNLKIISEEFMWRNDTLNIVTAPNTILLTVPGKPGGPGEPVSPWREGKKM